MPLDIVGEESDENLAIVAKPGGKKGTLMKTLIHALPLVLAILSTTQGFAEAPAADDTAMRGREMQSKVYAEIAADDPWLRMSQEHLFAQIWTRPGLTLRDRRLIALTAASERRPRWRRPVTRRALGMAAAIHSIRGLPEGGSGLGGISNTARGTGPDALAQHPGAGQ